MFALAQDWFMVFPALVPLVIFTAEHVYSGNPGDRFSAQGVIPHNKRVIYNWYKAVWVYMKHGVYSKQYSLAKRADEISDYLVFMAYVGCFSSKSMVSTCIVSYLLVYTWHTPLHYPHAANAGCVLAPVIMTTPRSVTPIVHIYNYILVIAQSVRKVEYIYVLHISAALMVYTCSIYLYIDGVCYISGRWRWYIWTAIYLHVKGRHIDVLRKSWTSRIWPFIIMS